MSEPSADHAFRHDPWFAGFVDGEGCFILNLQPNDYIAPQFGIGLREDDKSVLAEIHRAFGGSFHYQGTQASGSAPQWRWRATGRKSLAGLVAYFDRFPLRSKKRADYEFWRPAVQIYCAKGGRDPQLLPLREAMMSGRRYNAPATSSPAPVDWAQLEFAA